MTPYLLGPPPREAALALLLSCAAAAPPPGAGVVVAVGDLHGDLADAEAALRAAGAIDAEGRWALGVGTLVQTGDILDRGPAPLEVAELFMRLEGEAAAAGGRVVVLLGNHELMNLQGDWSYVSAEDVADFGSVEARAAALSPGGRLGRWLRSRPAVAVVGDTVFAHGGVAPSLAARGVEAINAAVRRAVEGEPDEAAGPLGPLWFRGYVLADEARACPALEHALDALGAHRMVVGHTPRPAVEARCGGRLVAIDTGMVFGGLPSALRIEGGDARAVTPAGTFDLPDPP